MKEDLLQRGETGSYGRTNVNVETLDYRVSCGDAVLEVQVNTTSVSYTHLDVYKRQVSEDC